MLKKSDVVESLEISLAKFGETDPKQNPVIYKLKINIMKSLLEVIKDEVTLDDMDFFHWTLTEAANLAALTTSHLFSEEEIFDWVIDQSKIAGAFKEMGCVDKSKLN